MQLRPRKNQALPPVGRMTLTEFVGEEEGERHYYQRKFEKLERSRFKISLNFSALIFSVFWCFYRQMLIPGLVLLACNCAAIYLNFAVSAVESGALSTLMQVAAGILSLGPTLACGLFGNYFYMRFVQATLERAETMEEPERSEYLRGSSGTNVRVLIGVFAVVFVFLLWMVFTFVQV